MLIIKEEQLKEGSKTKEIDLELISLGLSHWRDVQEGINKEWLVANGIGGYASSTVLGVNVRRYHGYLIASLEPPVERWVLFSKVEEEVGMDARIFLLSTNQYSDIVHPQGYQHLVSFSLSPFPTFYYFFNGVLLKKEVFMVYQKNITVVMYTLVYASTSISLYLHPLVTSRPFHNLLRAESKDFTLECSPRRVCIRSDRSEPFLWLSSDKAYFYPDSQWYYNFQYIREKERGLDFEEDLFKPGCFTGKLRAGESLALVASTELLDTFEPELWRKQQVERIKGLLDNVSFMEKPLNILAVAADSFIVNRKSTGSPTIIAGYPWFSDWGRDALIALPGLTLVTGRFEEAKGILINFARLCRNGLLPNFFPDSPNKSPSYNSVDTSLWFFYALYKYWQYTGDLDLVYSLKSVMEEILNTYQKGGPFNIRMKEDYLIWAGNPQIPLTWMDAKVGPWVVTPRNGAAVEINALWYNAVKVMALFSEGEEKERYEHLAEKIKSSFNHCFWNPEEKCLYDCLGEEEPVSAIRPNQIFSISLPFPVLDEEDKAKKVMDKVWKFLYTPYGLRSLSVNHLDYKGSYQGDRWLRDGAYHQGSVWPWLLGHFITAFVRINNYSLESRNIARQLLQPLFDHLYDGGLGTNSEIFWGDFPHLHCGCISQAWSVAEVLRAYVEDIKGIIPQP